MDILICFALVFMICGHTLEILMLNLSPSGLIQTGLVSFIRFFGNVTAAPAIMFSMGITVSLQNCISRKKYIEYSFFCCFLGILINIVRSYLPLIFDGITKQKAIRQISALFETNLCFYLAFFFLFFALISQLQHRELICAGCIILFLLTISLMPSEMNASSAGLPLLLFPLAGFLIGKSFLKDKNKETYLVKIMILAFNIVVILSVLAYVFKIDHICFNTIWAVFFVCLWTSILLFISSFLKQHKPSWKLPAFSRKHFLLLYSLSWLVLTCSKPLLERICNFYVLLLIAPVMGMITYALAYFVLQIRFLGIQYFSHEERVPFR